MPHCSPIGAWEAYRAEFPTCERTIYLNTRSPGVPWRRARVAGLRSRLPHPPEDHAGIMMFPADNPVASVCALKAQRIVLGYQPGHVPISPYFDNPFDEHTLLIERLRTVIHGRRAISAQAQPLLIDTGKGRDL